MEIKNQVILAVAPHLDDIEFGCLGTLHKLSATNTIYYLSFSFPDNVNDQNEFLAQTTHKSLDILSISHDNLFTYNYPARNFYDHRTEILQNFYDIGKQINPDIVFIPNSQDIHQAHQVVHEEALRIFKNKTILGYEFPWNNFTSKTDVFMQLSQADIDAKLQAISNFPSHGKETFFENGIIQDLANLRGKQINLKLAEAFELIRLVCK